MNIGLEERIVAFSARMIGVANAPTQIALRHLIEDAIREWIREEEEYLRQASNRQA